MTTIDISVILSLPREAKIDLIETLEQLVMDYRDFKCSLDVAVETALEIIETAPMLSELNVELDAKLSSEGL